MAKAKVSNKAAPHFYGNDLAKIGVDGGWSKPDEDGIVAMLALGLLETDGQPDEDGDVFYKASEAGLAWLKENGFSDEVKAQPVITDHGHSMGITLPLNEPSPFAEELDSDVPMPERKRGGPRTRKAKPSRYKFDELELGMSQHIAATDKVPNPAKSYSSVVSGENAKYGTPITDEDGQPVMKERKNGKTGEIKKIPVVDYSKHFVIFAVGADDKRGAGARIMRDK